MLDPLRFAFPLLLVRRAFDTAIPSGDVAGLIWIGAPDTVYYLADGKLIRQPSPEPVAVEFAARPVATVGG
jgi:hypothetical protein